MFCNKCGSKVSDGATFCNKCGNRMEAAASAGTANVTAPPTYAQPQYAPPPPQYAPPQYSNVPAYSVSPRVAAVASGSLAGKIICAVACAVVIISFFSMPFASLSASANVSLFGFEQSFGTGSLISMKATEIIELSDSNLALWVIPVMAAAVLGCLVIKNNKTRAVLNTILSLLGLAVLLYMFDSLKDTFSIGGSLGGVVGASTSVDMKAGFWVCLAGLAVMLISPAFSRSGK